MLICKECDSEFSNHRALNGHKRVHGPSKGRYSVKRTNRSRKGETKVYCCQSCGKENKQKVGNFQNKFCDNKCQQSYLWETKTKPAIERGERVHRAVLYRYIVERDGEKCSLCGLTDWQGKHLSMDVDHIDGTNTNNKPHNLRLLCPNCHRQTPTWGNKRRDLGAAG